MNIQQVQIIADIVHNVPAMLKTGSSDEGIEAKAMQNAKRQDVEKYFADLFEGAKRK